MDILTQIEKRSPAKTPTKKRKMYQLSNGRGRVTTRLYTWPQAVKLKRRARAFGLDLYAAPLTVIV